MSLPIPLCILSCTSIATVGNPVPIAIGRELGSEAVFEEAVHDSKVRDFSVSEMLILIF